MDNQGKIVEYCLVEQYSAQYLTEEVNRKLKNGWELFGETWTDQNNYVYLQVVVRRESPDPTFGPLRKSMF